MKKINILKNLILLSVTSLPLVSISCVSYPNDDENLVFDAPFSNENKEIKIELENKELNNIKNLYSNEILNLIEEVKSSYRNYKIKYFRLIRKIRALENKITNLIPIQEKKNADEIEKFHKKWFADHSKTKSKLANLLEKYQLIFNDVDAVIGDLNLNIDSQQFLKRIKVIDRRLNGVDINLGELQENIISSWNFLKSNLFNLDNITKKEDIEKINLDADKNSHSHSHAVVNLVNEMGLWHQLLKENVGKDNKNIVELKADYQDFKKNVILNIDHLDFESDSKYIIDIFEGNLEFDSKTNLIDESYKTKAKTYMNQIKETLLKIAKKEGLSDDKIKPFLDWKSETK
ncbi:HxHSH motif-containing lipoprotein [Metamycoplasma auris]|uniref:Lipoprotein n=1 Tax=Metamycoplasma auris TaxID=51363 RepID=A0A2W7FYM3_9BACT|nr:hypothetical protein [Metamycoplasma auris]PZV98763.1 hypothetical protein BCF89_11017 [Metamycoplasma auris]